VGAEEAAVGGEVGEVGCCFKRAKAAAATGFLASSSLYCRSNSVEAEQQRNIERSFVKVFMNTSLGAVARSDHCLVVGVEGVFLFQTVIRAPHLLLSLSLSLSLSPFSLLSLVVLMLSIKSLAQPRDRCRLVVDKLTSLTDSGTKRVDQKSNKKEKKKKEEERRKKKEERRRRRRRKKKNRECFKSVVILTLKRPVVSESL